MSGILRHRVVAGAVPAMLLAATWALSQTVHVRLGGAVDLARKAASAVPPSVTLQDPAMRDQDDMCLWVHPTNPELSTVITSDKSAGRLFVYDLSAKTIQALKAPSPGNIDLRYGFPLAGRKVDIVAFNQRSDDEIWVYVVDAATRKLARVDNGAIRTGANYGGTLFRSPKTGKVYFITTCNESEQYELADDGTGKVSGRKVRQWKTGYSEGAVGDDELGRIYIGQEDRGVWELGGEPDDPTPGKLVARVGENGLRADVEGLAIYHVPGGKGYLLVSSQSGDDFKVYRRQGAHEFLGTFAIRGVRDTDGIDVTNVALGEAFPNGLFACHTDRAGGCPVVLTRWDDIAKAVAPPLQTDTTWDPRAPK